MNNLGMTVCNCGDEVEFDDWSLLCYRTASSG